MEFLVFLEKWPPVLIGKITAESKNEAIKFLGLDQFGSLEGHVYTLTAIDAVREITEPCEITMRALEFIVKYRLYN